MAHGYFSLLIFARFSLSITSAATRVAFENMAFITTFSTSFINFPAVISFRMPKITKGSSITRNKHGFFLQIYFTSTLNSRYWLPTVLRALYWVLCGNHCTGNKTFPLRTEYVSFNERKWKTLQQWLGIG